MKLYILFLLLCNTYSLVHAGFNGSTIGTASTVAQDMYLSSPLTQSNQASIRNLIQTISSYPTLGILSDESGNQTLHQGTQNRAIKAMTPEKTRPLFRHAKLSILRPSPKSFKNYPKGVMLFPGYPEVSAKFDQMVDDFNKYPQFIAFLRKVHINVLNELYDYLMAIYMNFNLQHPGIKQRENGELQISVPLFLQDEQTFAANNKTLIINHLMAIIESQFNGAIRSYAQNIPHTFATFIGKTAIQNDYSVDLTHFIIHQIEPELIKHKLTYLQTLGSYLSFFQLFTSYLYKPHPKKPDQFTAFVDIAEQINQYLYGDTTADQDKGLAAIAKMNPPLFHFRYDDIRALKLLPHLAKAIPKNVKTIEWPSHIVEAAQEGLILDVPGQKPHPIAYFRTSDGIIVRNLEKDTKIPLYLCMRLGDNLFEQKLIPQPEWLNSWEGVSKILRACYGDFSALLGLNILDPCMETLVANTVLVQQGKDPNAAQNVSKACTDLISKWKTAQAGTKSSEQLATQNAATFNIPSIPTLQAPGLPSTLTPPLITQP